MSIDQGDMNDGVHAGASHLLARGAADDVRADDRIRAAIDLFFVPAEAQLDERLRGALSRLLRMIVTSIESELRHYGGRLLVGRGEPDLAIALSSGSLAVLDRLERSGLIKDAGLIRELLARVEQEAIGDALPLAGGETAERPSLLVRLTSHRDPIVAASASALMIAEARRHNAGDAPTAPRSDLPAELHHRLVWWTAAILRDQLTGSAGPAQETLDRAITEAALRSLAAHDEGERLEAAAMRLTTALAATADELPGLLAESLGDRRPSLFIALLAHALGLGYETMREIVIDPVADRLWLALRAVGLDRPMIATIGLALCEADPRRDVEVFADRLDAIAAIPHGDAREALASLRLHPDLRAAVVALARAERS
ncbi:MAG: hypothetical protein B7Y45_09805 [Sphingomonas sp. 28-66-16]|nr:MAG: hypothetical protein B7Y45_09805 [Sphingomonas sp. 28-66-16]